MTEAKTNETIIDNLFKETNLLLDTVTCFINNLKNSLEIIEPKIVTCIENRTKALRFYERAYARDTEFVNSDPAGLEIYILALSEIHESLFYIMKSKLQVYEAHVRKVTADARSI